MSAVCLFNEAFIHHYAPRAAALRRTRSMGTAGNLCGSALREQTFREGGKPQKRARINKINSNDGVIRVRKDKSKDQRESTRCGDEGKHLTAAMLEAEIWRMNKCYVRSWGAVAPGRGDHRCTGCEAANLGEIKEQKEVQEPGGQDGAEAQGRAGL